VAEVTWIVVAGLFALIVVLLFFAKHQRRSDLAGFSLLRAPAMQAGPREERKRRLLSASRTTPRLPFNRSSGRTDRIVRRHRNSRPVRQLQYT
jgi:hypothetical protein